MPTLGGTLSAIVAEDFPERENSKLGKGGVVRDNVFGGEKGLGGERVEEGGLGGAVLRNCNVKVEFSGLLGLIEEEMIWTWRRVEEGGAVKKMVWEGRKG